MSSVMCQHKWTKSDWSSVAMLQLFTPHGGLYHLWKVFIVIESGVSLSLKPFSSKTHWQYNANIETAAPVI